MDIESFRAYCLSKPATTESSPFGPDVIVFKVMEKMFALMSISGANTANLKNKPEINLELRDQYEGVIPGYHMNKQHWNTVSLDLDVPDEEIRLMIDQSFDLVVAGLPKKLQEELK